MIQFYYRGNYRTRIKENTTMKIKRILCMATAAAIGASLAGCGGKTNVAESDVTTITVWTTDSH